MLEIENITDQDYLLKNIHKNHFEEGEIIPCTFDETADSNGDHKGVSTNWAKYSTAEQTQAQSRKPYLNGVVQLVAGEVRNINLVVIHDPIIPSNYAHSLIQGIDDDVEKRLKLIDMVEWIIPIQ